MIHKLFALTIALALGNALCAQDQTPAKKNVPAEQTVPFVQKPEMYPLDTCIVSGEKLADKAVIFVVDGMTFKTCCEKCKAKVTKDPATYQSKLSPSLIAAQAGHYPLGVCVISGGKLGAMGQPVQLLLDNTLVQLCCSHCQDKATAKASEMAATVRTAAYEAQSKTYPLSTCLVSGEALGKGAVSVLYGTTLVRFCCKDCIGKFEAKPADYMAKLHPAASEPKNEPAKAKGGGK
ncbi:MAG: hypothetical protein NT107_09465 [Planctomycetota bacterium]|nr:hypothetical protein [Planctomycetota bacterium]